MFQSFPLIFVFMTVARVQFVKSSLPPRKPDCITKLNFIPREAVTEGVDPGDILQVTCFTPLWSSPLTSLLSLSLGISARSDGDTQIYKPASDGDATNITNSTQYNENDKKDNHSNAHSSSVLSGESKVVTTRMIIAALIPSHKENRPPARDRNRVVPEVIISPAFRNAFNTTASIQVPSGGSGLGLELRLSSATCDFSSRTFFCTATSCRKWHSADRGACTDHVSETIESLPVFVKGCRPPVSSRPGMSSPTCTHSTLLPLHGNLPTSSRGTTISGARKDVDSASPGRVDNNGQQSSTPLAIEHPPPPLRRHFQESDTSKEMEVNDCGECKGGLINCIEGFCAKGCKSGYNGQSCKAENKRSTRTGKATEEDSEVVSSFIIMGVSFAGGFIVGASLAGEYRPLQARAVKCVTHCQRSLHSSDESTVYIGSTSLNSSH